MVRRRRLSADGIIEVAEVLFSKHGYRTVRLEDVAASLGVSHAALYSFFSSKEAILAEVIERQRRANVAYVQEVNARDLPATIKFAMLLGRSAEMSARYPASIHVMQEEWKQLSDELKTPGLDWYRDYVRLMKNLHAQAVADGAFVDEDPSVAVRAAIGAANWICRWYRKDGRYEPRELAEKVCRIILGGLWRRETPDATLERTIAKVAEDLGKGLASG